jgi:hypothetical protein
MLKDKCTANNPRGYSWVAVDDPVVFGVSEASIARGMIWVASSIEVRRLECFRKSLLRKAVLASSKLPDKGEWQKPFRGVAFWSAILGIEVKRFVCHFETGLIRVRVSWNPGVLGLVIHSLIVESESFRAVSWCIWHSELA